MYEIELKAHVHDRKKTIKKIEKFAKFLGIIEKKDYYFHLPSKNPNEKDYTTVRIRKETIKTEKGSVFNNYVTYKKKEITTDENGISIEINEEKETKIDNPEVIFSFFEDAGFEIFLKKNKLAQTYCVETEKGNALLELCTVEKLGNFLEIEILTQTNETHHIEKIQSILKDLLLKAGISFSDIENRYYSDMLKEIYSENSATNR